MFYFDHRSKATLTLLWVDVQRAKVLIFGGTLNIVLGLTILSYHSFRISKTNPVDTLRYE